jgi:hypothetical protein
MVCKSMGRHAHIDFCRNSGTNCQGADIQHIKARLEPEPTKDKDWVSHKLYWQRTGFKGIVPPSVPESNAHNIYTLFQTLTPARSVVTLLSATRCALGLNTKPRLPARLSLPIALCPCSIRHPEAHLALATPPMMAIISLAGIRR